MDAGLEILTLDCAPWVQPGSHHLIPHFDLVYTPHHGEGEMGLQQDSLTGKCDKEKIGQYNQENKLTYTEHTNHNKGADYGLSCTSSPRTVFLLTDIVKVNVNSDSTEDLSHAP